MVLIDLAQVKGVSVRAAAQALLRLLDDPDNICQAGTMPIQSSTGNRHTVSTRVLSFSNVSASRVSDPRSDDLGCGLGSPTGPLTSDARHKKYRRQKHVAVRSDFVQKRQLRPEADRWKDSGARPCYAKRTFSDQADGAYDSYAWN